MILQGTWILQFIACIQIFPLLIRTIKLLYFYSILVTFWFIWGIKNGCFFMLEIFGVKYNPWILWYRISWLWGQKKLNSIQIKHWVKQMSKKLSSRFSLIYWKAKEGLKIGVGIFYIADQRFRLYLISL